MWLTSIICLLFITTCLVSVERLCVTTARALNEKMDFDGAANVEMIHPILVLSNPKNAHDFNPNDWSVIFVCTQILADEKIVIKYFYQLPWLFLLPGSINKLPTQPTQILFDRKKYRIEERTWQKHSLSYLLHISQVLLHISQANATLGSLAMVCCALRASGRFPNSLVCCGFQTSRQINMISVSSE